MFGIPRSLGQDTWIMQWNTLLLVPVTIGMLIMLPAQTLTSSTVVEPTIQEIVNEAVATTTVTIEEDNLEQEAETREVVPVAVQPKTALRSEMVSVCSCESTGRPNNIPQHYAPDGTVLRGRINPSDVGACQINLGYHQAAAESMGLDVFVEEDNYAYANYLYETQGYKPWSWSAHCHGKY